MATIIIPKDLKKEEDLVIIPRKQYNALLKYIEVDELDEALLKSASKEKLLAAYSESDSVYDAM